MEFNIVLYKPEIPPNTGNIARLCVGINSRLHIIGEPSFSLSEKSVKRAGLDYWEHLQLILHSDWESFLIYQKKNHPNTNLYILSTKSKINYTEKQFQKDDFFLFGNETSGLPSEIFDSIPSENRLTIPMDPICRCLNLSNSVAIVAYEAVRQINLS